MSAKAAGAPTINIGLFINQVLTFLIVAWALFMVVKGMNRLRRNQPPTPREAGSCRLNGQTSVTQKPRHERGFFSHYQFQLAPSTFDAIQERLTESSPAATSSRLHRRTAEIAERPPFSARLP